MNRIVQRSAVAEVSRRRFLITAVGSSVMLGFMRPGNAYADKASAPAAIFDPALWYSIDTEGNVTVNITKAEMGQHIGTAFARIVADELEADWSKVQLAYVDTESKWGPLFTGGSTSIIQNFTALSQAGAAGRIMLIEEGAKLLKVHKDTCAARAGFVHSGDLSISYSDIVKRGDVGRVYTQDELQLMPVKPVGERHLIGLNTEAIDIPNKTNGTARYGIDAVVEGMVYARPKLPPTRFGSSVVSIDDSGARAVKGYISSIALNDPSNTVPGWVMVFAETYPAAIRAADLVKVTWNAGETANVSEQDILDHGAAQVADPKAGALVIDDAGFDSAFAEAHSTLEQSYTTNSVLHFQLEPLNALAFEKDGIFEIHTGSQWQTLIIPTVATALGVSADKIFMRTYFLGGGFGRRATGDYIVPAALATKAIGKPVKMILTRADDARFDAPRSPSVQTLRIALDDEGKVTAMEHVASAGWPCHASAPAFLLKGVDGVIYDSNAISGADHWYNVGPQRVRAVLNDLGARTFLAGWLRSIGPGWINWGLESFMDEAAHHTNTDPVAFRLRMLDGSGRNAGSAPYAVGGALRQANVLRRVAQKAGWGTPMPKDSGLGIATTFGQARDNPTWMGCVAQVKVNRQTGLVTLEKLTVVVDAGTIIHPDGALTQVQSSVLWGVSMALHEGTQFAAGQVLDTNLDTYTPLRMGDVPELDIEFIDSVEAPTGLGEPGTTVIAPAIGNAIFAATGIRLKHLPIRPAAILQALSV